MSPETATGREMFGEDHMREKNTILPVKLRFCRCWLFMVNDASTQSSCVVAVTIKFNFPHFGMSKVVNIYLFALSPYSPRSSLVVFRVRKTLKCCLVGCCVASFLHLLLT